MQNDPDILDIKPQARSIAPVAITFGRPDADANYIEHSHPLPVRNGSSNLSLIERLNREGDPLSNFTEASFSSFAAPSGAGTVVGIGLSNSLAIGRAYFVQSAVIGSTTPIAGRIQFGGSQLSGTGSPSYLDVAYTCCPNYNSVIPVNAFVRSADIPVGGPSNYIKRWLDASVSGTHYVYARLVGWSLADSINFEAKKTIAMFGDSKWNGTGPSVVTKCIPWLINRHYRAKGVDCRYILKAYSGSTTAGHENFRATGRYDFERLDALFYNVGLNDAVAGTATATTMANVQAFTQWKQKHHPDAALVLFGPEPAEHNTTEANLAALRTAMAAYVTGLGDPKVKFCDLGGAFDRTVSGNYASTDTAGSRIHPDNDGNTFVWSGGYGSWAGLEAWLNANLAEI